MSADDGHSDDRPARVVVLGGGITGLETLLGLHELAGDRVDLTLVSPEPEMIYSPKLVQDRLVPGERTLEASAVVALPQLHSAHIAGLTSGFIPIDAHARVPGLEAVYAAGDATNFSIKQGGLGAQQADAAAEHIAALVGAEVVPQPFHPVLRGKLLTGDESISLRHDVTGGTGEGEASADYLWWPPHKVAGRYLAAFLSSLDPPPLEPPARDSLEVEVFLPQDWHEQPMALDPYRPPKPGKPRLFRCPGRSHRAAERRRSQPWGVPGQRGANQDAAGHEREQRNVTPGEPVPARATGRKHAAHALPKRRQGGEQDQAAEHHRDSSLGEYAERDGDDAHVPEQELRYSSPVWRRRPVASAEQRRLAATEKQLGEKADQEEVGDQPDTVIEGLRDPEGEGKGGGRQARAGGGGQVGPRLSRDHPSAPALKWSALIWA